MIDWDIVTKLTGGAYGTNIVVLIILAVIVWVIGRLILRKAKAPTETKEEPRKG